MKRLAAPSDLPGIIALWQEAFGDSPEAVSYFFKTFPNCISYAAEEDGRIVSMVHALPQVLSPDLPAAYLYAVATLRSHRGNGLCRQLMAFAEDDLKKQGFACCVLTPGEPDLFAFYKELGYETAFTRTRTVFKTGTPVSIEEYMQLRGQLLASVPHMVYDRNTLEYARDCYGLTFYRTVTGCAAANDHYTAECLPEDLTGNPFAMAKWLDKPRPLQHAYLGFALE